MSFQYKQITEQSKHKLMQVNLFVFILHTCASLPDRGGGRGGGKPDFSCRNIWIWRKENTRMIMKHGRGKEVCMEGKEDGWK